VAELGILKKLAGLAGRGWSRSSLLDSPIANFSAQGVIESFAVRRKRELLSELKHLDLAMASLLDDLRVARMEAGLVSYQELPTPMKSAKMAALELGRSELIEQRNIVLREHANL
jgi:hypothetical protein